SKIREIETWFNNTYVLRRRGLEFQVPVRRSKVKEFSQLRKLQRAESAAIRATTVAREKNA
ncbi:hypothetical protein GEP08_22790, partial [Salmonella enterica subsp. enterica serovar Anatum]|nr:hypothetical protein [Salmonella enterica subsp. enterica serovar Anatum]